MYRLKLIKARSYKRGDITATADRPYVEVEDVETARALLESGYFSCTGKTGTAMEPATAETTEAVTPEDTPEAAEMVTPENMSEMATEPDSATETGDATEPDYDALAKMTKAELIAFAKERGIDIGKCKNKSDILTEISIAYGGSPTMIDLQREAGTQGGESE